MTTLTYKSFNRLIYKHFPSAFPPPTLTDEITDMTDKL